MEFVAFDDVMRFTARGGKYVTLEAGLYRVEAAGDGDLAVIAEDGTATLVEALAGGHPLALDAPRPVAFEAGIGDRRVAVLLPGGRALVAGGARTSPAEGARQAVLSSPGFADALLKHHLGPVDILRRPPAWVAYHAFGWGTIEPNRGPSGFVPMTFPPNWVGTTVVTCQVVPKGSSGPGGPGTGGGTPYPPGTVVRRGPFPGYLVSTTSVRVTCSPNVAGRALELRVTAEVASPAIPKIMSMRWEDVYPIVPATNGFVDFPGVVVATGHVPKGLPPQGTTWEAKVQDMLRTSTGFGMPIEFDVYLDGNWITTRKMGFYASYPGGPPPVIADK